MILFGVFDTDVIIMKYHHYHFLLMVISCWFSGREEPDFNHQLLVEPGVDRLQAPVGS